MAKAKQNRREFLADTGLAAAAVLWSGVPAAGAAEPADRLHVAINQWSVGAVRGRDKQRNPLLVLEQGPEGKTPQTMDCAEVHRRSVRYVREVFSDLALPQTAS